MTQRDGNLPIEITKEAGALISALQAAGWTVVESLYSPKSFGNWYVDLHRSGIVIRLVKDRSQYMIRGHRKEELEPVGLWKAFDSVEEFSQAILKWAAGPM
jgi:hypothetical protein